MHVPRLLLVHWSSDWPDCTIEVWCSCSRSSIPGMRLLVERHWDQPIIGLPKRLQCEECRARLEKVWLVAGFHRERHGGPELDWAVLLRT